MKDTNISNGTVVYFKHAKTTTTGGKKRLFEFQGLGFGIFLGHVPPLFPEPAREIIISAMGQIGYISFDDITEFAGKEMGELLIQKWTDKYTKILAELGKKALESGKIKLVGADGKPVNTGLQVVPEASKGSEPCTYCGSFAEHKPDCAGLAKVP